MADELERLGVPALHDLILPAEHGLTQIDHVARGQDRLLVIETKTYRGHITGRYESEEWVQHLADSGASHPLRKPVWQNHRHRRAVEAVVAGLGVLVSGYVVSPGKATYSDDLAGLVIPLAQVKRLVFADEVSRTPVEMLGVAWRRVEMAAIAHEARRPEHLAQLETYHPTRSDR